MSLRVTTSAFWCHNQCLLTSYNNSMGDIVCKNSKFWQLGIFRQFSTGNLEQTTTWDVDSKVSIILRGHRFHKCACTPLSNSWTCNFCVSIFGKGACKTRCNLTECSWLASNIMRGACYQDDNTISVQVWFTLFSTVQLVLVQLVGGLNFQMYNISTVTTLLDATCPNTASQGIGCDWSIM